MKCPCLEKQAPAQAAAEKFQPDLFALSMPAMVIGPTDALESPSVASILSDRSLSLHVIHCIWLC
jgi:hypothetical protein